MHDITVLLHNIRSTHNVGSIFRTADGVGVREIWLSGYTPAPIDRFGRSRSDIAKAALGAELSIPWRQVRDARSAISKLKQQGWHIVAVEQSSKALDYRKFTITKPTCFVFGNEVRGLSSSLLSLCDQVIEIPMHGNKESLNVSVTAGIVLFHARR